MKQLNNFQTTVYKTKYKIVAFATPLRIDSQQNHSTSKEATNLKGTNIIIPIVPVPL